MKKCELATSPQIQCQKQTFPDLHAKLSKLTHLNMICLAFNYSQVLYRVLC